MEVMKKHAIHTLDVAHIVFASLFICALSLQFPGKLRFLFLVLAHIIMLTSWVKLVIDDEVDGKVAWYCLAAWVVKSISYLISEVHLVAKIHTNIYWSFIDIFLLSVIFMSTALSYIRRKPYWMFYSDVKLYKVIGLVLLVLIVPFSLFFWYFTFENRHLF